MQGLKFESRPLQKKMRYIQNEIPSVFQIYFLYFKVNW